MTLELSGGAILTASRAILYKTDPGFRKLIIECQADSEKGSKAELERHIDNMIDAIVSEIEHRAEFAPRLKSRSQIKRIRHYARYCAPIKKFDATVEIEFEAEPRGGKGERHGGER